MSGTIEQTKTTTQAASAAGTPGPATDATQEAQGLQCPTRVGGSAPLFMHKVTTAQCQSKQRGLYHKCFTCEHRNGRR